MEYADSQSATHHYQASCAYVYDSNDARGMGEPVPATFFGEEKVRVGETISAYFPRASPPRLGFLRRHVAERIPFSATNFTKILDHLRVAAGSEKAAGILSTRHLARSATACNCCLMELEAWLTDHLLSS